MNGMLRTIATPLSFITFLGVGLTGILLLFGIRGPMGDIHEWLGIAFIVALVFHLARNWRGVTAMLKTPASKIVVGAIGVATAVLIVAAWPTGGGHGGHGMGQIVYRMADAPIAKLAPAFGISGDQAVERLRSGGVEVDGPHETLSQISRDHAQPLPRLFQLLVNED